MWRQLPSIYFGSDIFFIRFFDGERFVGELLSLIGPVFNALVSKLDELGIPLDRCMSVTTDGAPAMVGTQQGFVARVREDKQSLLAFHCIIHQTVLCGKLNVNFQALMINSMKMINHLKSKSALRHSKLTEFLHETNAKYDDLLNIQQCQMVEQRFCPSEDLGIKRRAVLLPGNKWSDWPAIDIADFTINDLSIFLCMTLAREAGFPIS